MQLKILDISYVDELERLEKRVFSSPWTHEMFLALFKNEIGSVYGIFDNDTLAAYAAIYTFCGDALLNDGEIELANIAVSEEYRRLGLARTLLAKVYEIAKEKFVGNIFLEVRMSNISAKSLYLSEGFEVYGIRKNYYSDPREGACLMKKTFGENIC